MFKKFGKWYLYAIVGLFVIGFIGSIFGDGKSKDVPVSSNEKETMGQEQLKAERVAKEKAEAQRVAKEKAEAERVAKEKVEAERVGKEKAEAERVAKEKAEAQRVAKEKAEREAKKVPKDKYSLEGVTYKDTVMCVSKDKLVEFGIALQYAQKKAQKMVNKGECTIVPTNVPIYFKPESYSSKGFFMKMSDEVKMKYADGTNVFLFVNTSDIKYP